MGHKSTMEDLQEVHPAVYQNLQKLLAQDNVSQLGLVFQVILSLLVTASTVSRCLILGISGQQKASYAQYTQPCRICLGTLCAQSVYVGSLLHHIQCGTKPKHLRSCSLVVQSAFSVLGFMDLNSIFQSAAVHGLSEKETLVRA